ncbi:hypothetical protein QCA50_015104 [Cerrena zonata]|uniref:Uncharacterized protein n=1 Tax=Cerrena zonata TaxID=2478898 RepID=A0AAW0FNP4_9APHY
MAYCISSTPRAPTTMNQNTSSSRSLSTYHVTYLCDPSIYETLDRPEKLKNFHKKLLLFSRILNIDIKSEMTIQLYHYTNNGTRETSEFEMNMEICLESIISLKPSDRDCIPLLIIWADSPFFCKIGNPVMWPWLSQKSQKNGVSLTICTTEVSHDPIRDQDAAWCSENNLFSVNIQTLLGIPFPSTSALERLPTFEIQPELETYAPPPPQPPAASSVAQYPHEDDIPPSANYLIGSALVDPTGYPTHTPHPPWFSGKRRHDEDEDGCSHVTNEQLLKRLKQDIPTSQHHHSYPSYNPLPVYVGSASSSMTYPYRSQLGSRSQQGSVSLSPPTRNQRGHKRNLSSSNVQDETSSIHSLSGATASNMPWNRAPKRQRLSGSGLRTLYSLMDHYNQDFIQGHSGDNYPSYSTRIPYSGYVLDASLDQTQTQTHHLPVPQAPHLMVVPTSSSPPPRGPRGRPKKNPQPENDAVSEEGRPETQTEGYRAASTASYGRYSFAIAAVCRWGY